MREQDVREACDRRAHSAHDEEVCDRSLEYCGNMRLVAPARNRAQGGQHDDGPRDEHDGGRENEQEDRDCQIPPMYRPERPSTEDHQACADESDPDAYRAAETEP